MLLTLIDLFAAPGGLSLGFKMAGFKPIAGIDVDSRAMETYSYNFPETSAITADIRKLDGRILMRDLGLSPGDLDAVVGGPPCQGFSTIGRVKIASVSNQHPRFVRDARNDLYREFIRIVGDLQPVCFVMENVQGLISYRNGKILSDIEKSFMKLGYRVEWKVLNAVNFGVPQVRKRIFFIGTRLKDTSIIWPQETHGHAPQGNTSSSVHLEPPVTVWDAIGDLPEPVLGRPRLSDVEMDYDREPFSKYQKWARQGSIKIHNHIARQHTSRDIRAFSIMKEGQRWKDLPPSIKKLYGYRDDIFHDKMRRLRRDQPSWTVVAHLHKDGYMYIHPTQPRTITVREAARLQSFPDRFIFRGSRTDQFRQVGNAVPPLLARAVALTVREMMLNA